MHCSGSTGRRTLIGNRLLELLRPLESKLPTQLLCFGEEQLRDCNVDVARNRRKSSTFCRSHSGVGLKPGGRRLRCWRNPQGIVQDDRRPARSRSNGRSPFNGHVKTNPVSHERRNEVRQWVRVPQALVIRSVGATRPTHG